MLMKNEIFSRVFRFRAAVIGAALFLSLWLGACNLPLTVELETTPTATAIPLPSPVFLPTDTPIPVYTPTTPPIFITPSMPSATITPFFVFTPTPTLEDWSSCPGIVITVTDTADGDFLHVLRCADGLEYDLGPLTKGAYAVGPNDKFLVYCGNNGIVYAAKIGDRTLRRLADIRHEGVFSFFAKNVPPIFKLSFISENPYKLEVLEYNFSQSIVIVLPYYITD